MNFEQIRKFTPQILSIARKHGIAKISVFGSVARGETTHQSDVDFLVEMEEGASLFGVAGFGYEVEQLLGVSVDVIPVSALKQVREREFVRKIQQEAIGL